MADWPNYTPTRFPLLGVSRVGRDHWSIVCLDWDGGGTDPAAPACVGPRYLTKAEVMADLDRYARSNGYTAG